MVRFMRPLRLITHNLEMRLVVESLLRSLSALAYVVIVMMGSVFLFAVAGQHLLGGQMYFCTHPNFPAGTPHKGKGAASEAVASLFGLPVWSQLFFYLMHVCRG